jgi:pimeloyl-ACP methyl ester carboxylesterase
MTVATPTNAKTPDQCATSSMRGQLANGLNNYQPFKVDYLEAGSSGPVVMLVHSSVSGARQWRRLMDHLKDQFRVRAVNLFGYGKTPPWPAATTQTLSDQARLVEDALVLTPAKFISLVTRSAGLLP